MRKLNNKSSKTRRLSCFLLLFFVTLNSFSKSYSQFTTLKLNFKDAKLEKVISFIEKKTDYRFLYQTSEVDLKRKVAINYNGSVAKAVDMLFNNSSVYPVIVNKQIVLKKRVNFIQDRILSGRVVDEDKIPLVGVSVLVNDYERGTSTDNDGNYKINIKAGDKVSFSYVGFKAQEFIVRNEKVINVVLKEDIETLEEIVLVGYGKEKRGNVATAISTIKGNTVKTNLQSGESFDRGLDGLVKGVMVTQGTGELGKGADIIIRGVTSPFSDRNNNPLYIVDGVAISTGGEFSRSTSPLRSSNPLQSINPADIESVDILKDAAATAIYGSRGANGVIIIKTKQGLYEQPITVNLSFRTTVGTPIKTLDFLNASEFKDYILKLNQNSWEYYNSIKDPKVKSYYAQQTFDRLERYGFYSKGEEIIENGEIIKGKDYFYDPSRIKFGTANTNWNKETFRDAAVTSLVNASISGGAENSSFNVSLGRVDKEGILRADKKRQYSARLNTQFNVSEKLKFGLSANYSNVDIKGGYSNSTGDGYFTTIGAGTLRFRPDVPVYDKNGNFFYDRVVTENEYGKSIKLYPNPVVVTTLSGPSSRKDDMLLTNVFGEYNITKDLMFKTEYSYGVFFSDGKSFRPKQYSEEGIEVEEDNGEEEDPYLDLLPEDLRGSGKVTSLDMFSGKTINSSINYTLNYTKLFGKNSLKGLLGYSHTHDKTISNFNLYHDFITDIPLPQYAKIKKESRRTIYNSGLNSYFARVSYVYDDKYTITAVTRLDRSSKFAPENRNAFFPSIAAGWNIIHKESLINKNFLSSLRLRASAGLTGSVSVGDFAYLQRFNSINARTYKEVPSFSFAEEFANRKLQWEKTTEYNVGFDFEVKRGLVRGTVDLYHKTTSDVVSKEYEVVETGVDGFQRNNAKVLNKGFEISLGSDIINTDDFSWSVDVNASKNINKVLEVSGAMTKDITYSQFYTVGREVNLIKGYVVNGIIQTPERLKELNDLAVSKGKEGDYYDNAGTTVGDYEYKDINGDGKITAQDVVIIGSRQPDLFGGFNTRLRYKGIKLSANFSYAYGLESFRANQGLNLGRFFNIERYMSPQYRWSPTNKSATLPRLIHTGDHNSSSNRPSSANVFDASYLRLTSLKLGYDLPGETITNLGLSRVNMYVMGTNLATWTNFPGIDPQGVQGGAARDGNINNNDGYPAAKTFSIGVNLQF